MMFKYISILSTLCLILKTNFAIPTLSHRKLSLPSKNWWSSWRSTSKMKASSDDNPQSDKLGILLLNLGGPEKQEDVEGFLFNLFADPDIIRLPCSFLRYFLQKPLARLISRNRAPKSREAYQSIGGGSPILEYTTAQARDLEKELKLKGLDAKCYIGMRYWHPFTEEALEDILKDEINDLIILPLYPQYSISTSGSSFKLLNDIFNKDPNTWQVQKQKETNEKETNEKQEGKLKEIKFSHHFKHTCVPYWHNRDGYVKCIAKLINQELVQFTKQEKNEDGMIHILFSAHGVPKSYIEAGDPYKQQIEQCVDMISKILLSTNAGMIQIHLSFQSRVGPVEWLRPFTDDKIRELGESGVKNLVVVPISFVSEHIETLEEIDMEYKEVALESGVKNWRRCPAPNTDVDFIKELASIVIDACGAPTLTLGDCLKQFEPPRNKNLK